jgi:hypothetical protein
VPDWRIYYDDGSTFDSDHGKPEQAPPHGVICIPHPHDGVGRVILHGWDWYYWIPSENGWQGSDLHGLLDRLLHGLEVVALKQGRTIPNPRFSELYRRASMDPDFPIKTGRLPFERP